MAKARHIGVSVILPTLNERGSIVSLIRDIIAVLKPMQSKFEILVIDDDSADGTLSAVRHSFRSDRRIRSYLRKTDHGLGASILYGIRKSRGDIIVGMDADGNHNPSDIRGLLRAKKNADLVVGSRFVSAGGMQDQFRYAVSSCFNIFLRAWYGFPIHDNTSGFYAIGRLTLDSLIPDRIFIGYGDYHLRLVFHAVKMGLKVVEVPVYYRNRVSGRSKSKLLSMAWSYVRTARSLRRTTP